jgi:short-subunit dehydrogenase
MKTINQIRSQSRQEYLDKYGPWAVVTGASSGIGRELAKQLAQKGFNLVLVARTQIALEQLASELRSESVVETRVLAADLSDLKSAEKIESATRDLSVGLLVNNAGFGSSGAFLDTPLQNHLDMLRVNCEALTALSYHFGRRFEQRKRGGMIFLSSVLAFQGVPRAANYAATKACVQSLAEGLAIELAPFSVDILSAAPGPTKSGFAERANMRYRAAVSSEAVAKATLAALGRKSLIYPGWLSKFLVFSLKSLLRSGRVLVMNTVMKGMAREPDSLEPHSHSSSSTK